MILMTLILGGLCGIKCSEAAIVVVTPSYLGSQPYLGMGSWQNAFRYTIDLESTVQNETLYAGSTIQIHTQSYTAFYDENSTLNLSREGYTGIFTILSNYSVSAIGSSFGSFQFVGDSFTPYASSDVPATSGSLTLATIPEPSTYVLVGIGAMGLLMLQRRKIT